jgi:hypothetical protein
MCKRLISTILLGMGMTVAAGGCDWMDAYPNNPHTQSGDTIKGGSGSYGGTNTSSASGNHTINEPPQGSRPAETPGSGTAAAAGSGATDNSPGNVTGMSNQTQGTGQVGTATYGGSNAAGSDAGQTNNNGTSGPVDPSSR